MILQELHKEFAVNCFARFMSTSQTVTEFKEEIHEELPKPDLIQPIQKRIHHNLLGRRDFKSRPS